MSSLKQQLSLAAAPLVLALTMAATPANTQVITPIGNSGSNGSGCTTGCTGPDVIPPTTTPTTPATPSSSASASAAAAASASASSSSSATGGQGGQGGTASASGGTASANGGTASAVGSVTTKVITKQKRQAPAAIPAVSADGSVAAVALSTPFGGIAIPMDMQRRQAMGFATSILGTSVVSQTCKQEFAKWTRANKIADRANKFIDADETKEADFCETQPSVEDSKVEEHADSSTDFPTSGTEVAAGPGPQTAPQTRSRRTTIEKCEPCPEGTVPAPTLANPCACGPG